jgi:hypothetical protein
LSRSVAIDFARQRWRMTALTWLLLALSVTAAAAWIALATNLHRQIAQATYELLALQPVAVRDEGKGGASVNRARVRSVNDAIRRLNLPWETIFAALNAASTPQVALLSLEPDASAGVMRLMGEARSSEAMLALQRRLEAQPGIASSVVARHEVRSDGAAAPVRFSIEARWETPR